MGRDLGREGQDYLSVICNHVGLTANPSLKKDIHGWDYFIEFPDHEKRHKSIDELPPPIECKVQVKATEKRDKKLQVKVSVLYRLVKTHLPAFMLFLEYGKSHNPECAYLLHIDEQLMGKVLKRVRELEAKGHGENLHKKAMTIYYGDESRLPSVTGLELKKAIEFYIPDGLNVYTKKKNELLEKLGFEELTHKANITFTSQDNRLQDELIDLFIGVQPEIGVSKFELFSSRFGIDLPVVEGPDIGSGKLSLPNMQPSFKGVVYFKEDKFSAPVEFMADFYTPPAELNVSLDKLKFRAVTDTFELVYKPGAIDFKFKASGKGDEPLDAFFNRVWFLDKIAKGQKLIFGLVRDGKLGDVGEFNTSPEGFDDVSDILSLTEKSISICEKLRIKPEKVMVNYDNLMRFSKNIDHLYGLMFPPPGWFKMVVPPENDATKEDFINLAMIIGGKARIGSACFAYVYAVLLDYENVKESEEGFEILSDKTILAPVKYGTAENISELSIEDMKQDFGSQLEKEGKKVVLYEQ